MKLFTVVFILFCGLCAQASDEASREISGLFSKGSDDYVRRQTSDLVASRIPNTFLEETISRTYEKEYHYRLENQQRNLSPDVHFVMSWNAPVFTCEKDRLASIVYKQILGNHPESPKGPTIQLHVKNEKFELRGYECNATGDWKDGIVKSMTGSCPHLKVGRNLFLYGAPFYTFPEVADACCAKKGCSEKVYTELVRFIKGVSQKTPEKNRPRVNIK